MILCYLMKWCKSQNFRLIVRMLVEDESLLQHECISAKHCEMVVKYLAASLVFYIVAPRILRCEFQATPEDTSVNCREFMCPADKCFIAQCFIINQRRARPTNVRIETYFGSHFHGVHICSHLIISTMLFINI